MYPLVAALAKKENGSFAVDWEVVAAACFGMAFAAIAMLGFGI